MSKSLPFLSILALVVTLAPLAPAAAEDARAAYDAAQALKRSNHFSEAREAFKRVAESSGPGASNWAALAADELRYGLPLHESNHLFAQLAGKMDFPTRHQMLQRLDALYRALLDNNVDNLERVSEIERRRDQLAQLQQTVKVVEQSNTEIHLQQLRMRVEMYRDQTGQWPDRRRLEQELAQTARDAGLAANHFYIVNYYPSSTLFFATIRDTQGGAETILKGDKNGVKLERAGR